MNKVVLGFLTLSLFCCTNEPPLFEVVPSNQSGVTFTNALNDKSDISILDYLYYYNGGGVAVGDINNDGYPDIFFTSNQGKNKLYINTGDFSFEEISKQAGIEGKSSWNTGATMADVNGDGLLDIYVCAVVGINGFVGHNELFINNGDNTFTEQASQYGLDTQSYSSSAAFFDYDLDGDLDLYLLNHAVHTQNSYGHSNLRYKRNPNTGDLLFRNDNGTFVDVSEVAGIYGGVNAYGLGLATADFNLDGYPDIFIGNDFHEDDYLYINNQDGTFKESLKEWVGHTSRFSMGSDIGDINRDGYPDLISLDMLPENEKVLKASEGDDNVQTQKMRIQRYGYHYQFTRNMLFVNRQGEDFMETALMSGVAATDWSWSALFADFDNDSEQDLFISNGIPKRPNDLDFIKFVSNDQIQNKITKTRLMDRKALELMPTGECQNFIFKGQTGVMFKDKTTVWLPQDKDVSGATAYADFDRDGDLDLVINNLNEPAKIYRNKSDGKHSFLQLEFQYKKPNFRGIGTRVYSYHDGGQLQSQSLYISKGFQGASEPLIHFGYQYSTKVDSLIIVWPDNSFQRLKNIPTNQRIKVSYEKTMPWTSSMLHKPKAKVFREVSDQIGIDYTHKEDNYIDFNREKLIPYKGSDRGPAVALGDLNGDGKTDIFLGSSKLEKPHLYLQKNGKFFSDDSSFSKKINIKEFTTAAIADFNGDEKSDLFVGAAGADFSGKALGLKDHFWISDNAGLIEKNLPDYFGNSSVVCVFDYDQDQDLDVFIGNHMRTGKFGTPTLNFVLTNDGKGNFAVSQPPALQELGMITDAAWVDTDENGIFELWIIGEWMSPRVFTYEKGDFKPHNFSNKHLKGLWQSISFFDIDQDGDQDICLGNWGLNSKFKASQKKPLKMYFDDFDDNGQTETIVCVAKEDQYYPIHSTDELTGQLIHLRKGLDSYSKYAGLTIEEIMGQETLQQAKLLEVNELRSGYLKNDKGSFEFIPFDFLLQQSPITDFHTDDYLGNGNPQLLVGGNYFGVKPYHGRFDSFPGALILNENQIELTPELGLNLSNKSLRHLSTFEMEGIKYLLVVFNNDKAEVYQF